MCIHTCNAGSWSAVSFRWGCPPLSIKLPQGKLALLRQSQSQANFCQKTVFLVEVVWLSTGQKTDRACHVLPRFRANAGNPDNCRECCQHCSSQKLKKIFMNLFLFTPAIGCWMNWLVVCFCKLCICSSQS